MLILKQFSSQLDFAFFETVLSIQVGFEAVQALGSRSYIK